VPFREWVDRNPLLAEILAGRAVVATRVLCLPIGFLSLQAAHEAQRREQTRENLRQIKAALDAYQSSRNQSVPY